LKEVYTGTFNDKLLFR